MSDQDREVIFIISNQEPAQDFASFRQKQPTQVVNANTTYDEDQNSDAENDNSFTNYHFQKTNKLQQSAETQSQQLTIKQFQDNHLQDNHNSVIEQTKIENEISPIVLQAQQEDDLVDLFTQKKTQSLYRIASELKLRKTQNIKNFNEIVEKRADYYRSFTKSLNNIQDDVEKIFQQTDIFGKDMIKSLKQIKQAYRNFSKQLSKISFVPLKQDSFWGKLILDGLNFITEHKTTYSQKSKMFYQWLQSQCIPKVQDVFSSIKQKTQAQIKQTRRFKQSYSNISTKNLLISTDSKFRDLLQEQFRLNKIMEEERNKIEQWGTSTSNLIQCIHSQSNSILEILKYQVSNLIDYLKTINRPSHQLFQTENFWISIPSKKEQIQNSLISQLKIDHINRITKEDDASKVDNLKNFLTLQQLEKQTGNIKNIVNNLVISSYKATADFYKKNDWKQAHLLISADNHLLLLDEHDIVRNCMDIKQTQYKISELQINIKEREKGLFTTWNREKIRFNSDVELYQFTTMMESMRQIGF